jgi:Flp pilus assembly protein TadB
MLRSRAMKIFAIFETVCCAALVTIAIVAVVLTHATWLVAAAAVLGTASVCWGFLYLVYFGKLFRRRRQMRWLLERIPAGNLS